MSSAAWADETGSPIKPEAPPRAIRHALETISADRLLADIKVLASDQFEGRAPATAGELRTVSWLTNQFGAAGLSPGNPDGSWFQNVPMAAVTAHDPSIAFRIKDQSLTPAFPSDCVIWSKRQVPAVSVQDSEVVFAGYGVVAPEYGWDDFKNADVRGKTILVLINDPQVPVGDDPNQLDPALFKGRAMTYYGRWTYKYEIAAKKGVAAVIIIHETPTAGYPWSVVVDSNSRENFDLQTPDKNLGRAAIEGWMTREQASKLLAAGGFDLEALKKNALSKDFRPVSLGITASFSLKNEIRLVNSVNVAARLEGSSRRLRDEQIIYTAHWDHLGRDPRLPGDPVFHGALDNASGVAGLLELAHAFRALPRPPRRSILFLSVTAEEKGLLGSQYYARHPLYPLAGTLADLNMDGLNPWGRTADLEIIGLGNSSLEDLLIRAAAAQGRTAVGESRPERGYFYRSDHFEFAKVGVPALYFKAGTNYVGKPSNYGTDHMEAYVSHDYHKPSDQVRADWDLSGAVEDLRLLFQVGWMVAEDKERPVWKSASEFKSETAQHLFHE